MSPIIPSRFGHPKYNIFPQKSRAASLGGFKQNQRGTPGQDSKSRRKQRVEESKITVQPTEDEDGDNFYSKHLAAARFQRNHRLINVLFSDVVVDIEQPPDTDKFNACRKHVKDLVESQKRVDDDINKMNEKFNAKKAKLIEDSKKFAAKLDEFVTKSKKDIEALKLTRETRRQQEATLRLQTKSDHSSYNNNAKTSTPTLLKNSSETKPDSSAPLNVESINKNGRPTEVLLDKDFNHSREVRIILDKLITYVANGTSIQ